MDSKTYKLSVSNEHIATLRLLYMQSNAIKMDAEWNRWSAFLLEHGLKVRATSLLIYDIVDRDLFLISCLKYGHLPRN